jgi:phosphoribosylcarboxyaminoimidazole (NCAIR) mutase
MSVAPRSRCALLVRRLRDKRYDTAIRQKQEDMLMKFRAAGAAANLPPRATFVPLSAASKSRCALLVRHLRDKRYDPAVRHKQEDMLMIVRAAGAAANLPATFVPSSAGLRSRSVLLEKYV